ncbi:MAG: hypothetical protein JWN72_459, partial [Thermoleophilia bacterium]|nr:hypothetical protein [Thermoleophilia bacterium]
VAEPEPAVAESEPEPAVAVAEPEPAVVEAEPEPAVAVAKTELEPPVVEADVEPAVAETETESLAVPSVDDDLEARIAAAIELEIPAATAEPELLDLPSGAPGVQVPDSTSGLEAATQAVWDLNRLPFLLPQAAAPEAPAPVADLLPTPSTVLPPAPPRARARTSVTLQDVDLAPRMPVTAAELPQGRTEPIAAPIAIARLDAPLFAPGMVPTERPRATNPGEARARIAERRAQLAATMAELAALGSDDTRRS